MSVRETGAAMYARISPSAKLVLIFMGEACGDDDDCHVSVDFLVAHTGLDRDKVLAVLAKLQDEKLVTYRGKSLHDERCDAFWIHTEQLDARRIRWTRGAEGSQA
jgi:hypothetical protein